MLLSLWICRSQSTALPEVGVLSCVLWGYAKLTFAQTDRAKGGKNVITSKGFCGLCWLLWWGAGSRDPDLMTGGFYHVFQSGVKKLRWPGPSVAALIWRQTVFKAATLNPESSTDVTGQQIRTHPDYNLTLCGVKLLNVLMFPFFFMSANCHQGAVDISLGHVEGFSCSLLMLTLSLLEGLAKYEYVAVPQVNTFAWLQHSFVYMFTVCFLPVGVTCSLMAPSHTASTWVTCCMCVSHRQRWVQQGQRRLPARVHQHGRLLRLSVPPRFCTAWEQTWL